MTRTAGSVNRKTQLLKAKMEKLGCDPIEALIRVGKRAEQEGDLKTAAKCFGDLASFVEPKLKAVEVTGDGGGPAYVAWMPAPAGTAAEWMAQHAPGAQPDTQNRVTDEDETDGDA